MIDALRGVAALSVAWMHLTSQATPLVRASGSQGSLGVDAFFVISGFVVPYSLAGVDYHAGDVFRFMARRMVRLEPPYLASIALTIIAAFASASVPAFRGPAPHYTLSQIASHLFYLVPLVGEHWINDVYWSLAYEFAFYLAVGLTFALLWRRNVAFTIAAFAIVLVLDYLVTKRWDGRLPLFLIGIAGARWKCGLDRPATLALTAVVGAFAVAVFFEVPAALVGTATVLAICFLRLPPFRPLVGLGAISYSLYLTHTVIGVRITNLADRLGGGEIVHLLTSLFALAASIGFAWLWWRFLERPAIRASRQIRLTAPSVTLPVASWSRRT